VNTSLMMLDEEPVELTASYAYPKDDPRFTEVEGGIDWRMKMRSGINIQGSSSYCYSPYASRQRYFGSDASIIMDPATTYDGNTLVLHGNGAPQTLGGGPTTRQFAAQLDGFSQAARDNKPHLTPGEMGLRDIRLMEAMYRSADAGGVAVKL
jgi:glucose-fructose oxidoreductase